ncbi:MAG: OprO/OprP family phosphate-selective porin [bacterium]
MIVKNSISVLMAALLLTYFMNASARASVDKSPVDINESKKMPGRRLFYNEGVNKKDQGPQLECEGVLMWDHDHFTGAHIDHTYEHYVRGNETELRRASLTFKSKIDKNWKAELEISLSDVDEAPEAGDVFIEFTGWDWAEVIIGQTKEPFGLEEQTSSQYITAIERSMATNAFAPGSHPGIALSGDTKQLTWAIGIYEGADREEERDTYALTGRLTFTPWEHKKRVLHVGVSGSFRNLDGEDYEIKENAEVHTAEKVVVSDEIPADTLTLAAFEAAWVSGPLCFQAEYMGASVKALEVEDATYSGYYVQGSYCLTGESRPYKKGGFKEIKPDKRFGALEMMCRYSVLDAKDNGMGDAAMNLTLGANYYSNTHVRIMVNYIYTALTGDIPENEKKAQAISYRLQYSF